MNKSIDRITANSLRVVNGMRYGTLKRFPIYAQGLYRQEYKLSFVT